jgi:ribosomal protein L37AE/L43A
MRKYKPVELPLRPVPADFAEQRATCPNCLKQETSVIGRLGLRLVFRCEHCRVRFHRPSKTAAPIV